MEISLGTHSELLSESNIAFNNVKHIRDARSDHERAL